MLLTDAARKNEFAGITHARDRLLVDSTDVDKTGRREDPTTDLTLVDPLDPAKRREARDAARHRLGRFHVLVRRPASCADRIQIGQRIVCLGDGRRDRRAAARAAAAGTTAVEAPIASGDLNFSRDGKGLFLSTDRDGEFRKLAFLDLATGNARLLRRRRRLGRRVDRAVAGRPHARRHHQRSGHRRAAPLRRRDAQAAAAPAHADRQRARPRVARELARPRGLGQQRAKPERRLRNRRARQRRHALDRDARRRTRRGGVSQRRADRMEELRRPGDRRLPLSARRRSSPASGRSSSRSTAGRKARRDPDSWAAGTTSSTSSASRSSSRTCAGSTGYGKTFVALDNGMKREDSVKDIGALLDWIATQPDLDAEPRARRRRQLRRLHGARRRHELTPTGSPARSTSSASPTS